jgi:hypothetical protein
VAQAQGCDPCHESSILSGQPSLSVAHALVRAASPLMGTLVFEFFGRSVSGKPSVFEADFGRSIRPLPATAGSFSGRTLLSDSRCRWFESIPGCQFLKGFRRVSSKGQDRTLRTFRLPFESAYPHQSGLRPIGRGRSAPNAEIPVRIRGAGPILRGGGRAAKAPGCLSGPGGFDSLPPRQFFRVRSSSG